MRLKISKLNLILTTFIIVATFLAVIIPLNKVSAATYNGASLKSGDQAKTTWTTNKRDYWCNKIGSVPWNTTVKVLSSNPLYCTINGNRYRMWMVSGSGSNGYVAAFHLTKISTPTVKKPEVFLNVDRTTINAGDSIYLSWSVYNSPTRCWASENWSGNKSIPANDRWTGAYYRPSGTGTKTFSLTCSNSAGQSNTASKWVTIRSSPPTLSISVDPSDIFPGGQTNVRWSTSNATSCSGNNSGNSYSTSGSQYWTLNKLPYTFGFTCTGPGGGSVTKSATVQKKTEQSPVGYHDGVNSSSCSTTGWAYDPDDTSKSISVDIYADGPTGGTGVSLGRFSTTILRSNVNSTENITGNHGFNIDLTSKLADGKSHTLYIYAIDSSGQSTNPLLKGSPKTINCEAPKPVSLSVHGLKKLTRKKKTNSYRVNFGTANTTSYQIFENGALIKSSTDKVQSPRYDSINFYNKKPGTYVYNIKGTGSPTVGASATVVVLAQCEDGEDNDSDGDTDYPGDLGCSSASDNNEYNAPPIKSSPPPPTSPPPPASPVCGDGSCNGTETNATCSTDCPPVCGDGSCNGTETNATCSTDCPPPSAGSQTVDIISISPNPIYPGGTVTIKWRSENTDGCTGVTDDGVAPSGDADSGIFGLLITSVGNPVDDKEYTVLHTPSIDPKILYRYTITCTDSSSGDSVSTSKSISSTRDNGVCDDGETYSTAPEDCPFETEPF